ncbi:MAG: hypothetical protein FWE16_05635 [Firmicutes bacterium]|nr:hypothetical protein [Bacillota bacterium]
MKAVKKSLGIFVVLVIIGVVVIGAIYVMPRFLGDDDNRNNNGGTEYVCEYRDNYYELRKEFAGLQSELADHKDQLKIALNQNEVDADLIAYLNAKIYQIETALADLQYKLDNMPSGGSVFVPGMFDGTFIIMEHFVSGSWHGIEHRGWISIENDQLTFFEVHCNDYGVIRSNNSWQANNLNLVFCQYGQYFAITYSWYLDMEEDGMQEALGVFRYEVNRISHSSLWWRCPFMHASGGHRTNYFITRSPVAI